MLLFNFQGPLFLCSRFERSCSISHLSQNVNTFLQIFSEFFKIFLNISRNTISCSLNTTKTQEAGCKPCSLAKILSKNFKIRRKSADFGKNFFKKVFKLFFQEQLSFPMYRVVQSQFSPKFHSCLVYRSPYFLTGICKQILER